MPADGEKLQQALAEIKHLREVMGGLAEYCEPALGLIKKGTKGDEAHEMLNAAVNALRQESARAESPQDTPEVDSAGKSTEKQDTPVEKTYLVVQWGRKDSVEGEMDVSFRLDFSMYAPSLFGLAIHAGVMAAAKTFVSPDLRNGGWSEGSPFVCVFIASEKRLILGRYMFSMDTDEQAENAMREAIKAVRKKIIEIIRYADGNQ